MDLATWMRNSELFLGLDKDTFARLGSMLGWRVVLGGELVIAQGDPADKIHLIAAGHYEVTRVAIADRKNKPRLRSFGQVCFPDYG
jgi:CRP-like cAMP-binding protein